MARGEEPKTSPRGPGLIIAAIVIVVCLGALWILLASVRSCAPARVTPPAEPFPSATATLATLGWRDCIPYAGSADTVLDLRLRERGYVELAPDPQLHELPFEIVPAPLAGTCGVLVAVADATGHVTRSRVGSDDPVTPCNASVLAAGTCGDAPIRVEGIGQARLRYYSIPGLSESIARATTIPPDALLALAEAEILLRRRGWTAEPTVWYRDLATTPPTSIDTGVAPASGCVPYVVVVMGAGHAATSWETTPLGNDLAVDRALVGGVACSATTGALHLSGTARTRIWSMPFALSGPSLPSAARLTTVGAARSVDRGAVVVPAGR